MTIKQIFDEIANEGGTNMKMEILGKYKDNEELVRVLYLANSKRVKFFIKQIPEYKTSHELHLQHKSLEYALDELQKLSNRELTGNAAIAHLQQILGSLCADDAYIIERIIEKDCKIGMGTRNINKVIPDLIEKTGYMGCKPYSRKLIDKLLEDGRSVYSQEKMDGRIVNIVIQGGEVQMESRQGDPTLLEDPALVLELKELDDCVLNGELTMDGVERYQSNGMIASLIDIAKKGGDAKKIAKFEKKHMPYREALDAVRVTTWDILTLDEYYSRTCTRQYHARLAELVATIIGCDMVSVVETRIVSSLQEVMAHFTEVLKRNGEGTVVKSLEGVWADKKPNYQIKVKKEMTLDLKVVGFNYGTAGTKNENVISSLNVESEEGLLKTKPQGIDEEMMIHITDNQDQLMGMIVEVVCSGLSQNEKGEYSTLHPRFKMFRDDKDVANTLEECIEIDESASLL